MALRFNQLWQSVALSNLTDGSLKIFLPFVALSMAVSPSDVAYVLTFLTLSWPLFGFLAGVITDRVRIASLPVWCHAIRVVLFTWLAIEAARNGIALWHLYLAAFIYGLCDVVFEVLLPRLVLEATNDGNRGYRVRSNTRLAATYTVASEFLGPVLGTALSLYDPVLGFSIIAFFYGVSGMVLSVLLRARTADDVKEKQNVLKQPFITMILEPVRWLLGNRALLLLAIVGFSASLSWGAWISLEPYYLIEKEPQTITKTQFGFLMSVLACGAVAAALLFEKVHIDKNNLRLLFFDVAGIVGVLVISAITKNPLWLGFALFLTGTGATIWSSIVITMRQELVPKHLLGGVNGLFRVVVYGGLPVGSSLAGTLTDFYPIPIVFGIIAALSTSTSGLILLADRAHRMKRGL